MRTTCITCIGPNKQKGIITGEIGPSAITLDRTEESAGTAVYRGPGITFSPTPKMYRGLGKPGSVTLEPQFQGSVWVYPQ